MPGSEWSDICHEWYLQVISDMEHIPKKILLMQCRFHPACRKADQVFTLAGVLERSWKYARPVFMDYMELEKAYNYVRQGILLEVFVGVEH